MKAVRRFAAVMAVYMVSVLFCVFGTAAAHAYDTVCARIPVNCCEFAEAADHEYIIKIEAETQEAPVPEKDVLEIAEDGTGFFDISITEPGTFRYNVFEIAGADKSIRYDDTNYTVTVFVEHEDEGGLVYSVIANGSDESKSGSIEFKNLSVDEKGVNDDMPDSVTTSAATAIVSTSSATVTASAAVTTSTDKSSGKGAITRIVDSVLTGDSFRLYTVVTVMIIAFAAATYTFLFRRKDSEGEEKTDE